ncbi:MAG TPA: UDP-N-acetylglucosamine--LPS N-acetylglucosamine transferase [Firmicutes bacterium]|jgi:processive 1,2-diacylglycerol beta-glucosyltransferase|nr:UDP-N-acetylglucosamine--LPS N-acetylglucosamine transferase [Bacillota bacterium]
MAINDLLEECNLVKEECDVLILSASYGGGHNQVARALTSAIQLQAPGMKIITVDYCDLLVPLFNRLTQFGYMQSIRHFPVGYALYYQATGKISSDSFWQRHLNKIGYSELMMLVDDLQPRLIISTFPIPAGVLSAMKASGHLNVPIVTVITDMCVHSQWIHPNTDLYVVGSSEVADGLVGRGVPRWKISDSGIPILPEFNNNFDKAKLKEAFGFKPNDKVIIIMGGSDGIFKATGFKLHRTLEQLPNGVQALILTGYNQDLYEKLQPLMAKYSNFRAEKFFHNMAGLMQMADLLITKAGGITISEALASGLPMVIYKPMPGQEEINANYLWRHRAAIIAKTEHRVRTATNRLACDEQFRLLFQKNCLKLGHSDSAAVAAKAILNMLTPVTRRKYFISKI